MKRFVCLLLALAILLPGAAALADPEEWEYQSNGDYTIRYPDYMNIYSVLKEEYGWDMDVLESAAETGEEEFSVVILYAGMDDWLSWLETGSFPDIQGNMEKMGRVEVDEPPVDIRTGMETTFAQYMSADGKRMREVWIFDADEGDLDRVVICRWAADADGFVEHRELDREAVDVEAGVVAGVRDRGLDGLLKMERGLQRAERHDLQGLRDRLALDFTRQRAALLGREAHIASDCGNFHLLTRLTW